MHLADYKRTFHQRVIRNKIDLSSSSARGHLHDGVKDKMSYKCAVFATRKTYYPRIVLGIVPIGPDYIFNQLFVCNTGL